MINLFYETEGYLDYDVESEYDPQMGATRIERYFLVGCPEHEAQDELTNVLMKYSGKYIKITVEEIPFEQRERCGKCRRRFNCLTTNQK